MLVGTVTQVGSVCFAIANDDQVFRFAPTTYDTPKLGDMVTFTEDAIHSGWAANLQLTDRQPSLERILSALDALSDDMKQIKEQLEAILPLPTSKEVEDETRRLFPDSETLLRKLS